MRLPTLLILAALTAVTAADPVTAIAFGDSITFAGDLKEEERWVGRIAAASQGKLLVVNEGQNGRTSTALSDFDKALARTPNATLVIIVLGTNDLKNAPADIGDKLAANLAKMVDAAATKLPKAKVMLAAPYNINPANLGDHWRQFGLGDGTPAQIHAMRDAVRLLATKRKLDFVDLDGVIPAANLPDGIHPDAVGHAKIAEAILAALKLTPRP